MNPAAALRMAARAAGSANEQRAQLRLPALEVNDRGGLSYCFQWVHLTGVQLEQRRNRGSFGVMAFVVSSNCYT